MRDTAFKYKQHGIDLTKSMLNNISSTKPKHIGATILHNRSKPMENR
jgi:hypothetical protein